MIIVINDNKHTCLLLCVCRLHVVLVQELFRDLLASHTVFLGRPLNSLTWPELLRQYLEMVMIEQEEDGTVRLTDEMGLVELCDALQCACYEELPFKTKVRMLLLNFHLALETKGLRHYVDSKQDVLEVVANEKRLEFDRLRKEFNEHQIKIKAEKAATTDLTRELERSQRNPEKLQQDQSPAVLDASSDPVARAVVSGLAATKTVAGVDPGDVAHAAFGLQDVNESSWRARAAAKPISQMDGANESSSSEEEEDEDTGMVVDDDDEDVENEENASGRQASSSEENDDQSGDESGDDNMEVDRSRHSLPKNASDDDEEVEDGMSKDEDEDDADNLASDAPQGASAGSSARTKPLTLKQGSARVDALAQAFKSAWCELTNNQDYDQEVVNIKVNMQDPDQSFSIHELYWSVQSFGGSTQIKKWKMAANDMVMRKTGRPCVPVPGRGYGYVPKAWEKWRLSEYEQRYGAHNVPPEYKKPAFVATRKAMLLASGLPLSGRRKSGGDLESSKRERAEQQKQLRQQKSSEKVPGARSRTSGGRSGSRSRGRGRGSRGGGGVGGGGGGVLEAGVIASDSALAAQVSSPEVVFLLKLLESKTLVRGLTKEEAAIKRAIDRKHKKRLSLHRAKTESLGSDRYRRQYWVLGNDFSTIWVQRPSTMLMLSVGQRHSTEEPVQSAAADGDTLLGDIHETGSCSRRSEFVVLSSAEQVNRLMKGLDSHGVRENELIESIELYRDEFSAAMGAPIASVVGDTGDKDPVVSAALALTLAGITPLSAANPSSKVPETSSAPRASSASSAQPTGFWERDSEGMRKWALQSAGVSQSPAAHPTSTKAATLDSVDDLAEASGSHQNVVQGANEADEMSNAPVLSCAAKFLQTRQPLGGKDVGRISVLSVDFSQRLYAKSTSVQVWVSIIINCKVK
jgi:uncharacterized membrane protein YgcG